MEKTIRRLFAMAMAAVLAFSISPTINAEAVETVKLGPSVYYLYAKSSGSHSFSFDIPYAEKITKIKSTDPSIAKPTAYSLLSQNLIDDNRAFNNGSIQFTGYKPGKTNIKYYADGKKYVKRIMIKDYVNPLKSLTINNKNVTKKLNKSSYGCKVNAARNMKVKAETRGDWYIQSIEIVRNTISDTLSHSFSMNPKTGSLSFSDFGANNSGRIKINLCNMKCGATISLWIDVKAAAQN